MKIGILMIATGKYIQFFDAVYNSFEEYFLPGHEKTYFLFTDSKQELPKNVVRIKKVWRGFPEDTLKRFHYFSVLEKHAEKLEIEAMYYSDVDMEAIAVMGDEILPGPEGLVATYHPGFYKTGTNSFDTNHKSTAKLTPQDMKNYKYVCGGFQGGETKAYFEAMKVMIKNINIDEKKGIMAKYHDESHWNKYVNSHKEQFKFLTPSYCYPESKYKRGAKNKNYPTIEGLTPRLLALDKNHQYYRS